jgi:hypothetical protein
MSMNILRTRTLLAPALLLAALSGCDGLVGGEGDKAQRDELRAARNRWEAANVNSYSYVIELFCVCGSAAQLRPVRVTVVNDAVASRVYESNDPAERTPAPETVFGPYDTVEELFTAVENSIGNDADLLNVAYDPNVGVPVLLQYDPDSGDADDHLIFQISGFAKTNP